MITCIYGLVLRSALVIKPLKIFILDEPKLIIFFNFEKQGMKTRQLFRRMFVTLKFFKELYYPT